MSLIPGFTMEQKVVTVANDDIHINDVIVEEALESWMVSSITLSGANVIILFSRTIASA